MGKLINLKQELQKELEYAKEEERRKQEEAEKAKERAELDEISKMLKEAAKKGKE